MDLEKLEKAIDFTTNLFVVRQNEGGVEVFHPMTHHKRVVHTFEQAVAFEEQEAETWSRNIATGEKPSMTPYTQALLTSDRWDVQGKTVTGPLHGIDGPHYIAHATTAEYARLIAALPDLLSACKAAVNAWHVDPRNFERELRDGAPEWLRQCRKALLKAEKGKVVNGQDSPGQHG